jgi:RNA-binding protein
MNNQQEKTLLPIEKKRELKRLAHHLKPVVLTGKKGMSPALINEIDEALESHELIKVQIHSSLKENLLGFVQEILRETDAQHIDTIGNIVILFRKLPKNSRYDL